MQIIGEIAQVVRVVLHRDVFQSHQRLAVFLVGNLEKIVQEVAKDQVTIPLGHVGEG